MYTKHECNFFKYAFTFLKLTRQRKDCKLHTLIEQHKVYVHHRVHNKPLLVNRCIVEKKLDLKMLTFIFLLKITLSFGIQTFKSKRIDERDWTAVETLQDFR